jgi:hypothetical protein
MRSDDGNNESFEEQLRAIAQELGRTVERAVEGVDLDEIASSFGIDPDRAREWAEGAGGWLRAHAENLGEEMADRMPASDPTPEKEPRRSTTPSAEDPLENAGPHPLDLPSEEQGRALAALDSGRWTVEPGSNALAGNGDGPPPDDALGLVRELRVRDWISAEGTVTVVGLTALRRWLESEPPR